MDNETVKKCEVILDLIIKVSASHFKSVDDGEEELQPERRK